MKSTSKQQQHAVLRRNQKRALLDRMRSDAGLSSSAYRVADALLNKFFNNGSDRCNPSGASIAKAAGLSRRWVVVGIAELNVGGWINVESIGGGSKASTNRYSFDWERTETRKSSEETSDKTDQPADDINKKAKTSNSPYTEGIAEASPEETEIIKENGLRCEQSSHLPSEPQGVNDSSPGVNTYAHEPERTDAASRLGEGSAIAPRGFAAALEEESAAKFEALRAIWMARPYGVNRTAALKAYQQVCADHGDEIYADHGVDIRDYLLTKAGAWIAKREAQYLPALEKWLADYAWLNDPPDKGTARGRKASYIDIAKRRMARDL
jgi:hypothetical protein